MKKTFLKGVLAFISALVLLFAVIYLFSYNDMQARRTRDERFASEIKDIRNNKDNWELYENSEIGFSLMIPPNTEIREDTRGYDDTDDFGSEKFAYHNKGIVFIQPLEKNPSDAIRISKRSYFEKRIITKTEVINGNTREYYNKIPASNSFYWWHIAPEGSEQEYLAETELLKRNETLFMYYNSQNKNIFAFTVGDGGLYEYFYNDNLFPFREETKAKPEIYQLELDILKTIKFFPPSEE